MGSDAESRAGSRRAKPLHRFALQAAILLGVLGWVTAENPAYPRWIHAQANLLFAWEGADRWLEFEWVDPQSRRDRSDTLMRGMSSTGSGETERRWRAVFSVRRRGFWPLATWLAVVLATPMPATQRLRKLVAGAIVLDFMLLGQFALIAISAFGATQPGAAAFWQNATGIATGLFNSPVPTYSLLFVMWVWMANPVQTIEWTSAISLARRWVGLDRRGAE